MIKTILNKLTSMRKVSGFVAIAAGLTVGISPTLAFASVTGLASPVAVEYSAGSLLVQLPGGANYLGVVSAAAGCTANNQTLDTLKAWQSLTQAALLSGKSVKIYYNTCSSVNYISTVDIWQ